MCLLPVDAEQKQIGCLGGREPERKHWQMRRDKEKKPTEE